MVTSGTGLPDDAAMRRLLEPAAALALRFAEARDRLDVTEKSPGQLVSEADLAVEAALREALGAVPILGEEGGGGLDADGSGWAIDPIDGTTNFVCGLPLWGISAGLMAGGRPVAGGVALPELRLTLTGARGRGVWCNVRRLERKRPGRVARLMALGENAREAGDATDARAARFRARGFTAVRYNCALFSLANVALGRLDGYVEHGCSLWDIAAGWLLCEEAGVPVRAWPMDGGGWGIEAGAPG